MDRPIEATYSPATAPIRKCCAGRSPMPTAPPKTGATREGTRSTACARNSPRAFRSDRPSRPLPGLERRGLTGTVTWLQHAREIETGAPQDHRARSRARGRGLAIPRAPQPAHETECRVGWPPLRPERVRQKSEKTASRQLESSKTVPRHVMTMLQNVRRPGTDATLKASNATYSSGLETRRHGQDHAGAQPEQARLGQEQLIDHDEERGGEEAHLHSVAGLGERAAPCREGDHGQSREIRSS